MDKDYRSLEHKIRDVVEASMNRNTELRRKVVNVGRPDTAPSNFDDKSKLAKQGEIKTKIIDEAKDKKDDEDKDDKIKKADADDKDDKKKSKSGEAEKPEDQMTGGKTEVDLEPKTDDKVVVDSDDKPKKTKKVTKEETMLKSDNKFGLPQDLIDAVTEAMKRKPTEEELKGNQHKIDKNKNGKIDAHDFKLLRKEEAEEIDEVSKDTLKRYVNKATHGWHPDSAINLAAKAASKFTDRSDVEGAVKDRRKAEKRGEYISKAANKLAKEEFELDEAVKTGNEGHGYHGEAHHAAKGEDKMAEAGKAYAKAHSLVKQHAADHLKNAKNPNVMVKHYLDSKHGRHLYGNENNAAYVKKDFGNFAKSYNPKMHEEVEQLDEIGNTPKGKAALKRYVKKADRDSDDHADVLFNRDNEIHRDAEDGDEWAQREYDHADKKYHQRLTGMERARKRLHARKKLNKEEVEELDELSKQTLASYVNKAGDSRTVQGYTMAKSDSKAVKKRALNRDVNRMIGIRRATNRLAKEEVELSADEIARLEKIAKGL